MPLVIGLLVACALAAQNRTPVVVSPTADPVVKLAASELARYLARLYPRESFPVVESSAPSGRAILVRTGAAMPPESFVVKHNGDSAVIEGADPRGTLFGVYALLEKLGYGFYLSYDASPPSRQDRLSFDDWDLSDEPVAKDRVVFDWHNFLSSASTWEFADWQLYIDQAAKMRFNTIMVHAYGNNPIFTFRYNGVDKPVGYLATTRAGRDWGTQHVNDVRRLIGGEVFKAPVFGASVAMVPERERAPAARALMQKVFAYARSRGMHVTFALDVDTESANPQNIIATLPPYARIVSGKYQLANPDTPEGYEYYKAQARQLFEMYPQIDRLAVWFRVSGTPWRNVTAAEFPPSWKTEFERHGSLTTSKDAAGMFAVSKLVRVFGRALKDIGRSDVELSTGSWRLEFLSLADAFFPPEASIMPLDWSTLIDTDTGLQQLKAVKSGRKLIPIVWAHHDDRTYIGRPYTPFDKFTELLRDRGASGFGIIHWTTRPLDLYFKSLSEQVWKATENQPLRATCEDAAAKSFGEPARRLGGEYLHRFLTEAPMFGRETSNRFMDIPLKEPERARILGRERLELLSRIKGSGEWLAYFRDYEQFMLAFIDSHTALERAQELAGKGAFDEAAKEIVKADPQAVIAKYVTAARRGRMSRGEEALIVSLNLRWLPYVVSVRQAVGLDPVRVRFDATQHEPLAQGAGSNTFFIDERKQLWKVLGDKETAVDPLKLGPMMGGKLRPGRYRAEVSGCGHPFTIEVGTEGVVELPFRCQRPATLVIRRIAD